MDDVKNHDYINLFDKLITVQKELNAYLIDSSSESDFGIIREKRKEVLLKINSHKKLFKQFRKK